VRARAPAPPRERAFGRDAGLLSHPAL